MVTHTPYPWFGELLVRSLAQARSSQLLQPHYLKDQRSLVVRSVCQTPGKNVIYRENFDVGGRALNEGNNQSASPRSHLKAYQVTLNDSVTMANNLTKSYCLILIIPGSDIQPITVHIIAFLASLE